MKLFRSEGIKRRSMIETLIAVVVYLAALYLCVWFIQAHPGTNWGIIVAMVPIMGIAWALFSAMRYVRGMDELHQKMHLEALAFAFLAQWFILIAYGFLWLVGIRLFDVGLLAPIMMLLWIIGLMISMRRYR